MQKRSDADPKWAPIGMRGGQIGAAAVARLKPTVATKPFKHILNGGNAHLKTLGELAIARQSCPLVQIRTVKLLLQVFEHTLAGAKLALIETFWKGGAGTRA